MIEWANKNIEIIYFTHIIDKLLLLFFNKYGQPMCERDVHMCEITTSTRGFNANNQRDYWQLISEYIINYNY